MTVAPPAPAETTTRLRRGTVPLIALCCGVTVANIYVAHPLLTLLAEAFGVPGADAGVIITISQISYAAGLFFLVQLGDVVRRKRLLAVLVTGTSLGLLVASVAVNLPMLAVATVVLSALTVAPHVLIPYAVSVVPRERQGRTLAMINAGMTGGIVLSRVIDAAVGDFVGWNAVYLLAAATTVLVGTVTVLILPREPKRPPIRYTRLVASTLRLLRDEPTVRWAVGFQIPVFATFNLVWVMIVFPLTDHYGMSVAAAGLFGMISLVTVATAPFVGRFLDAAGSATVMMTFLAVLVAGAGLLLLSELHLAFLVTGLALLNVGQQGTGISNQSRVLNLLPEARSRLNTLYMTSNFIGGALASLLAVWVYAHFGWTGVTMAAFGTALVAAAVFTTERACRRRHGPAPTSG
ncbi:MFS transporter [Microbacterium sp. BWT-B31]|uniref:MFS transporter n=1 Tax=Microbacterium sp. BWT-B31 TaxID=3232072 RepID=UPI003528F064